MKICQHCGASFTPRRGGRPQIYCSNVCKVKWLNNYWNARAPRKTTRRLGTKARLHQFTQSQKQLIFGTLLGDGSLIRTGVHARLSMTHGLNQRAYMMHKRNQLAFAFHKKTPNECETKRSKFLVIASVWHPFFDEIYPLFYVRGRKRIPRAIISDMDALMLAIWYQDDGSFNANPRAKQATLCTDAYPLKDVLHVSYILTTKFNINNSLYSMVRGNNCFATKRKRYHRIVILRTGIKRFFQLIRRHVHPSMRYKLAD